MILLLLACEPSETSACVDACGVLFTSCEARFYDNYEPYYSACVADCGVALDPDPWTACVEDALAAGVVSDQTCSEAFGSCSTSPCPNGLSAAWPHDTPWTCDG